MTNAIGTVGTTGLTSVTAIFYNRSGQVWNGTSFVTYVQANLATYKIAATEQVPTGNYVAAVPSSAQTLWWFATFLDSSNNPIAVCENPSITDATIPAGTMLRRTVGRFGGQTPTRSATTGTKTFKDADGTTVMTETPTTTQATRSLS